MQASQEDVAMFVSLMRESVRELELLIEDLNQVREVLKEIHPPVRKSLPS